MHEARKVTYDLLITDRFIVFWSLLWIVRDKAEQKSSFLSAVLKNQPISAKFEGNLG